MSYLSSEVVSVTKASHRQLQWLDERSVISPRQEGHKRLYRADEVILIALCVALKRKGISLQRIRNLLKPLARGVAALLAGQPNYAYLITDGASSHFRDASGVLMFLAAHNKPVVLINLIDLKNRIRLNSSSNQ